MEEERVFEAAMALDTYSVPKATLHIVTPIYFYIGMYRVPSCTAAHANRYLEFSSV